VLKVEISGATLEDVFVELMKETGPTGPVGR
jgi:hypothetical protein